MVSFVGRLYSRRIINVNVNILLAGILALAPTMLVVHVVSGPLGVSNEWIINAVTFVADVICDVGIYYLLHWLANHWPKRGGTAVEKAAHTLSYFKDATLVQVERMMLSPLLYCVMLSIQHVMIVRGISPVRATAVGFIVAITMTRVLHTIWMIRQLRRSRAKQTA